MAWKEVGRVTHYFGRISVAAVRLTDRLQLGDRICVLGATSDFEQDVASMEVEHQLIEVAEAGQEIGLLVVQRVRKGDAIYRIDEV